jgi:hypothetical protein
MLVELLEDRCVPAVSVLSTAFLQQTYADLLHRPLDASGQAIWGGLLDSLGVTSSASRITTVEAIESAAGKEFATDEVVQVFTTYLQRNPTSVELSNNLSSLVAGATVEQLAANQVGSMEFFINQGGGSNDGFLNALFQEALGRAVDASGQATFGQALNAGFSRTQVAQVIFSSPEYFTHLVNGFYQQYLHRAADANGSAGAVSALLSGIRDEQIIAVLVGSDEYFGRLNQSTLTLTSSANPVTGGQKVTFTASLAAVASAVGKPTGTVTFTDTTSNTTLGNVTLNANGQATLSTSALSVGTHTITAFYSGDQLFTANSATLSQKINQPPVATTTAVTSSGSPSVVGQSVTFTVTITPSQSGIGTPTGTVTFVNQATNTTLGTGTLNSSGQATFTTSSLALGSTTIQARYAGDSIFTASNGSVTQQVNSAATSTALTSSANPSVVGQPVTLTAMVTVTAPGAGTPTGTVTFLDTTTSTTLGSIGVNTNGQALLPISTLGLGTHNIKATYSGDSNFTTSNGSLSQVVNQAATTTALTASETSAVFGQSVTFTASVTATAPGGGTPTGSVTFTDTTSGMTLGNGTLDSHGQATFSTSSLTVGTHTISASYAGDANFTTSSTSGSSNLQEVVSAAATTTAVTSSVNPSVFGQAVTITATVTVQAPGAGTPTGSVTFMDQTSGANLGSGTLNSSGVATIMTSDLAVGTHTIEVQYAGDGNFAASSNSVNQMVNQAGTGTSLASSANPSVFQQEVTFTATVTATAPGAGTPTGMVSFVDQTTNTTLGSQPLDGNGQVSLTTSALAVGTHTIAANYEGDTNFTGSSGTVDQVVNSPT